MLKGHVKACWNLINSMDGGVFQTEGAMRYYSEGMQARGTIIPCDSAAGNTKKVRDEYHPRQIMDL